MKINAYIVCIIFTVLSSLGAEFGFGTNATLSVTVPGNWSIISDNSKKPDGTVYAYTFIFKPRTDENARCVLSITYTTNGVQNKEALQKDVLFFCEDFVSKSVEKKANLKEFSLENGYGAYCLFTDPSLVGKTPDPGDYKVMGIGNIKLGKHMDGVVTLYVNDTNGKEFKELINIINSLKLKPKNAE
jgi:hypothetical protein